MKPFCLQKAIEGHTLCTRDGRDVTEFYYFKTAKNEIKCGAVINGVILAYNTKGENSVTGDSNNDLFLKSEKKKLFIRIQNKPSMIDENGSIHNTSSAVSSNEWMNDIAEGWQIVEVEIEI
jgi:hypothetical protein